MKKILTLVLLVVSLLTVAVTGHAEDRWKWVTSTDRFGVYLDTQSIVTSGPNNLLYSVKFLFPSPDSMGRLYFIGRENVNIKDRTSLTVYIASYSKEGYLLKSTICRGYTHWEPISGNNNGKVLPVALEWLNTHRDTTKK